MVFGRLRDQRGAGAVGCLFMLAITAAVLFAGFQYGMPRLRHSSFEERLTESVTAFRQESEAEIQKQIIQIATEFDIALTPAQVKVSKSGGVMKIDLAYDKEIDLIFLQKTQRFRTSRAALP